MKGLSAKFMFSVKISQSYIYVLSKNKPKTKKKNPKSNKKTPAMLTILSAVKNCVIQMHNLNNESICFLWDLRFGYSLSSSVKKLCRFPEALQFSCPLQQKGNQAFRYNQDSNLLKSCSSVIDYTIGLVTEKPS